MLTDDIAEVLRAHFPNPPATEAELQAFEMTHGFRLDPELRAFYAAANGAKLFQAVDSPYKILSLDEIMPGRTAIFGPWPDDDPRHEAAPRCPDNVWAFVDVQDGDYVGFEVPHSGPFAIIDMFHETWPDESKLIAPSFAEFLHRSVHGRSIGSYWLEQA